MLIVAFAAVSLIVYLNMNTLSEYIYSVESEYSETEFLADYGECDSVLDEVESYIQENQRWLTITDYARNEHSIEVTFMLCYTYIVSPQVNGYD